MTNNYCIKAVTDVYEGIYDINSLISARELTSLSSFKQSKKKINLRVL